MLHSAGQLEQAQSHGELLNGLDQMIKEEDDQASLIGKLKNRRIRRKKSKKQP
jgi:hypothetical protein